MTQTLAFTENYDDLSTDKGFQFRFYCRRCNNGYMSTFHYNVPGVASDMLRAAGSFFGDVFNRVADTAYNIQRAVGSPAHDQALQTAVAEIGPMFVQCRRCATWVCHQVCFNEQLGFCVECAPKLEVEAQAVAHQQALEELHNHPQRGEATPGGSTCRACHAPLESGKKFCGECGAPAAPQPQVCRQCHTPAPPGTKFCQECGTSLSG